MRKANHSLFLFFSVCSWAHLTARGQPLFPGVGSRKQTRASPCQQAAAPPPHWHSLIPSLTHDFEPGSHSFRAKLVLNLCSPASASQGMGLHLCTIILKISSFLCVCMCRFSELIFQLAYKIMGSIMVLSCMYHIWCWFIALPRSASRPTAPQPTLLASLSRYLLLLSHRTYSIHLFPPPFKNFCSQDPSLVIHNLSEVPHTKKTLVLIWVWLVLLNITTSNFRYFSENVMTLFFWVFSLFLLF